MFEKGAKIKCIDAGRNYCIRVGKQYTVVDVEHTKVFGLRLRLNLESPSHWYPSRLFKLVNPKYSTKPIDYTGCDPVVAEHLKRGEAVLCKTEERGIHRWIVGYVAGKPYPYLSDSSKYYQTSAPLEFKKKLKPLGYCIELLLDNGWNMDENGAWKRPGYDPVTPAMLLNWNIECSYPSYLLEEE